MPARFFLLVLLAFTSTLANSQSQNLTLGVWEDLPGHDAGDSNFRALRVIFEKRAGTWKILPTSQQSSKQTWVIGLEGRTLGRIKSAYPRL
jgi:hypothetical protein